MEEYSTAIARCPGKAGIEVMAQARANGRLIDHFKMTVNGSEVLNVNFPLSALFAVADLPEGGGSMGHQAQGHPHQEKHV